MQKREFETHVNIMCETLEMGSTESSVLLEIKTGDGHLQGTCHSVEPVYLFCWDVYLVTAIEIWYRNIKFY